MGAKKRLEWSQRAEDGAVAVVAFLQSYEVARYLRGTPSGRFVPATI